MKDTATVASPLGHGPSALNRAMTTLHSITSDLLTNLNLWNFLYDLPFLHSSSFHTVLYHER